MLAIPNTRWFGNRHSPMFPYTQGIINASLKDRYDVRILDADLENLSSEDVGRRIRDYQPDVVGISCMSMGYYTNFREVASLTKQECPDSTVVVGGIFPTQIPNALMKDGNVDFSVLGEGEFRFPELLRRLQREEGVDDMDGLAFRSGGDVMVNGVESYVQNLDDVPLPSYKGIDFDSYANQGVKYNLYLYPKRFPHAVTTTSRWCAFDCTFCSSKAINGPKIRYRSSDSVLKEIDELVEMGVKDVIFLDDNLYLNKPRINKILDGLIERGYDFGWKSSSAAVYALDGSLLEKMAQSGCYQVAFAIEAGTQEALDLMKKPKGILGNVGGLVRKTKSLGLNANGMFVIGTPGETWAQIRETFKLAEELDLDYSAFSIATPLPQTELFRTAKEREFLPPGFDFDEEHFRGFSRANITTPDFTPTELETVRAYEWDRINFATEEKARKIAEMGGLSMEEVEKWRVSTRRGLGVEVEYED